ncbi:MAG: hypothetical protein D6718_06735 [Acidobacteria bacterium]|nr:MAG: hypothetical protein D6718_06735 [Acidobacteriota bacterium]
MPDERPDIRFAAGPFSTDRPADPLYWDRDALAAETRRTFELCHSCRMCFKFCGAFPALFSAVDRAGDVRDLTEADLERIVDDCFQCKLCYTQCPYTEAEGHPFRLDFPQLVQRTKAVRRRVPWRDRLLADPDRLARLIGPAAPLVNAIHRSPAFRRVLEWAVGVDHRKKLPEFSRRPLRARLRGRREPTTCSGPEVVLFPTCYAEFNRPGLGEAALFVLEHNGCRVRLARTVCCGMPALEAGHLELARRKAAANVRVLAPAAEAGLPIAVINPTCSLTLREEVPRLLEGDGGGMAEAARRVAESVVDISLFLDRLRRDGMLREDFRSTPGGAVAYHAPCHLRAQNIGFKGRDLLRRIPGVTPRLVAECCGHDGTWSMKKRNFSASLEVGEKAFTRMRSAGAEVWVSDCPLAALQFEQACGRQVLHPVEVLARAYREDGFPQPIPAPDGPPEKGGS